MFRPTHLLFYIAIFFFAALLNPAWGGEKAPISLHAKAYLVKKDGVPLWGHRERESLPPASLTKIMTALLALELGRLDKVVIISTEAAAETGSRLGLQAGDQLTLHDLLQAMLIKSANDAAHAVAEAVCGSTDNFIKLMNARAAALRMTDTHYADVSGHDFPNHYTSARDLAILAEAAMRHPLFRKIVATQELTISTIDATRSFQFRNSNKLISTMPEVTGIKTGFTNGAGNCLVSMAERDGSQVLVVLLNDKKRWSDAPRLFAKAFESGTRKRVAKR